MQPQPSISVWLLSDVSRLKRPIPVFSVRNSLPESDESKVYAGSEYALEIVTADQAKRLLTVVDRSSLRGKRDYAMIAMLVGCGLRRGELLALRIDCIQSREEHWVIADLLARPGT